MSHVSRFRIPRAAIASAALTGVNIHRGEAVAVVMSMYLVVVGYVACCFESGEFQVTVG